MRYVTVEYTSTERESKNDLSCSLIQVYTRENLTWYIDKSNIVNINVNLNMWSKHMIVKITFIGLRNRDSDRLSRNLRNDEIDNWIKICKDEIIYNFGRYTEK